MELEKIAEQLDYILDSLLHVKLKDSEQEIRFAQLVLARCEVEKLMRGSNVNVRIERGAQND